jgi:hypothetical protein
MPEKKRVKTSRKAYRLLLFWAGIIATIAYRIIVVLNFYSALWVEIAWYIGTIGFVWYFAHRYNIEHKRKKLIIERKIIYKLYHNKPLDKGDRNVLLYIAKSLRSSKAQWNYIAIFAFSLLALIYAFYVNITKFLL